MRHDHLMCRSLKHGPLLIMRLRSCAAQTRPATNLEHLNMAEEGTEGDPVFVPELQY